MAGNQYHSEVGEYFIRCRHLGCPIDAHVVEGYIYSCSASIFFCFSVVVAVGIRILQVVFK